MDFNVSLRRAIKTGNVILGRNKTEESVKTGTAKLVILANNAQEELSATLQEQKDLPVYVFEGSSVQLGKACGKPFLVSALAIADPGDSDILSLQGS